MNNGYQFGQSSQQTTQPYQMPQYQPQLFPQPHGNVYLINNSLEVANVPMSAGYSVGLCLQEGVMYLKSMQNGSPMFMAYKITPYNNSSETQETNQNEDPRFQKIEQRFSEIEKQINSIKKMWEDN